jgi:hypothetical protein
MEMISTLKLRQSLSIFLKLANCLSKLPVLLLATAIVFTSPTAIAQTPVNKTMPSGSLIINMGIVPQTVANGLKPYGLLYQLLSNNCPVDWIINTSKVKDGVDFTYNGINYRGGSFIIEAQYRTAAVNTIINTWKAKGVDTVRITTPTTVPVYLTFTNVPKWTLDKQNGSIAVNFFNYAEIPSSAYGGSSSSGWKLPGSLDCCDDIFVMPHADPQWYNPSPPPTAGHGHLYNWTNGTYGCKGSIWLGCHAGSALMDMFNPDTPSKQTNFLLNKSVNAIPPGTGAGPYYENALILWGNHSDGTPPYSYSYPGEPIMQFMGTIDAAQQNGSEQIYIPKAASGGWYSSTHVGVYDPDHAQRADNTEAYRPATLAYGPAMGESGNGTVMLEASHNISGTAPANVAAQRAFFNFSLLAGWQKAVNPVINIPDVLVSGQTYTLSYSTVANVPPAIPSTYTTLWSSSCGGTFNPNNTTATTQFTAPSVTGIATCNISVQITDACNRRTFDNRAVTIVCQPTVTASVIKPLCPGAANGSINLTVTQATAPYSWTWTRTSPSGGPTSGTGTTISGLSAGNYSITVAASSGCSTSINVVVSDPPVISSIPTVTNVLCNGNSTGSIDLTTTGGTPSYTYLWNDGATTEDRFNLPAGSYSVTVKDANNCTANFSATITQPSSTLSVAGTVSNVLCYGGSTGAINVTTSGGTGTYTYDWGGGITTEDRAGLAIGTYNVKVTDANGCSTTKSFTVTQPAELTLSTAVTRPTCPPDAQQNSSDGVIDLTVSGGTAPYTYGWTASNGGIVPPAQSTSQDLTNLIAGTYSVTVTDANGCSKSLTVTLAYLNPNPVPPTSIIKQ